jgi:ATPase subunit of ABC transporter with duplicated ATPase domains
MDALMLVLVLLVRTNKNELAIFSGERNRVQLARVIKSEGNVLLLDDNK